MVATHMVAPRSNGLFAGAIMQSGPFDNYTVQTEPEAAFRVFADIANCSNAKAAPALPRTQGGGIHSIGPSVAAAAAAADADAVLECLRHKPLFPSFTSSGLIQAVGNTSASGWFGPTVDNVELSAPPEVCVAVRIRPLPNTKPWLCFAGGRWSGVPVTNSRHPPTPPSPHTFG